MESHRIDTVRRAIAVGLFLAGTIGASVAGAATANATKPRVRERGVFRAAQHLRSVLVAVRSVSVGGLRLTGAAP